MDIKSNYSVVVVGAGPAGSTAALTLAEKGVDVLLVEKQREVGKDIFCAEGISKNTLNLAKEIYGFEKTDNFIASWFDTVRIIGPDMDALTVRHEKMGVILERKIFDRTLAGMAVSRGAQLSVSTKFLHAERKNGKVELTLSKGGKTVNVMADLVIGADGPASLVASSLGLNMDVGGQDIHKCAQFFVYNENIVGNRLDFYFSEKFSPSAYAWVFPKGDGFANIGLGVLLNMDLDPMELLKTFLNEIYPGSKVIGWLRGVVPVGGYDLKIYADNLLVTGDAARLADPVSGGGIGPAILSGKIAGDVAYEALEKGDLSEKFLKNYEKIYWDRTGIDYKVSLVLRDYLKNYTDERIIKLHRALKKLFDGKDLETISLTRLFIDTIKSSKELFSLLLGSGGDVLFSLRKIVF